MIRRLTRAIDTKVNPRPRRVSRGCLWGVFIGIPWLILLVLVGEWHARLAVERRLERGAQIKEWRYAAQEAVNDDILRAHHMKRFPSFDEEVAVFSQQDEEGRQAWADRRRQLVVLADSEGVVTRCYVPSSVPSLAYIAEALTPGRHLEEEGPKLYKDPGSAPGTDFFRFGSGWDQDLIHPQQLRIGEAEDDLFQVQLRFLDLGAEGWTGLFIRESMWKKWGERFRASCEHTDAFEWPLVRQFSANRLGFRGPDIEVPKPPGVYRILCVGGSTTAWGPIDEATYPYLLQEKLRAYLETEHIEVVNAGFHGSQAYVEASRVLDFLNVEPDLVIHYNFVNDLRAMCHGRWRVREFFWECPLIQLRTMLSRSRLVFLYANRLLVPSRWEVVPEYEQIIFRELRQFYTDLADAGVDVAFCSFAYPDPRRLSEEDRLFFDYQHYYLNWNKLVMNIGNYARMTRLYNDMLEDMCRDLGAFYLDVAEPLSQHPESFTDDCHLTADGIEMKAERIFQLIKDRVAQGGAAAGEFGWARAPMSRVEQGETPCGGQKAP